MIRNHLHGKGLKQIINAKPRLLETACNTVEQMGVINTLKKPWDVKLKSLPLKASVHTLDLTFSRK